MKPAGQFVMAAAARLYAPVLVAIALAVLVNSEPHAQLGLAAGLLLALAPLLHALAFGADSAARAFPPWLARLLIAAGPALAIAGDAFAPVDSRGAFVEAGVLVTVAASAHLITTVLVGRAPTLHDADW